MQQIVIDFRQRGFTLIEALVALVVLSIGMLGIAALYVESLKAGRTAIYRTQAVTLAADMADRIRANDTAGIAYQNGPAADGDCDSGVDCTPQGMAAHDLFFWERLAANVLPNGQADVAYNAAPAPDEYTITISWSELGQTEPASYSMVVQI